jgi:hypothetical protein
VQCEPLPFPVRHVGQPYFHPDHLREQTLAGWHRMMGIELRLAAQALEALIQEDEAHYHEYLAEQCVRVGQLYDELKRRAGARVAQALVRGELRLLRYRASPTLAPLIYALRWREAHAARCAATDVPGANVSTAVAQGCSSMAWRAAASWARMSGSSGAWASAWR